MFNIYNSTLHTAEEARVEDNTEVAVWTFAFATTIALHTS